VLHNPTAAPLRLAADVEGSALLPARRTLPFLYNVYHSDRYGEVATADDPWKQRNSFERATTCPPRRRNFLSMPGSVPNVPRSRRTTRTDQSQ
jgi:heme/copper-type cytochrome/quinol oxidase subunit 1